MPLRKHVQLFCRIRAKVHLRGLEALVPQPQRDLADVAGGLENHQGAMIATDDPELVFLPGERFILRVLTALPTEDLSRDAALRAGLIALTRRAVEFCRDDGRGFGRQ